MLTHRLVLLALLVLCDVARAAPDGDISKYRRIAARAQIRIE